ncbi:uncharacterized protein LOC116164247 [Photinus pyralis]|uniref:uncharacterized protein LOC116164247 n=1 Tax=Photinus pyralis TaxID=7054 RepID=UPI0012673DE3|nr:uncharacterized protein LOC116164247 [Photinus pyralis]
MAVSAASVGHLPEFSFKNSDWTIYKARLNNYFVVNGIQDDVKKRAILLTCLCEQTYKLVYDLCIPKAPEEQSFDNLIKVLNNHFAPKAWCLAARYKFYNAKKTDTEWVNDWAARVRGLATHCEFGTELPVVLRDIFIMGFNPGPILDRLLEEKVTVSLSNAIEIAFNKTAVVNHFDLQKVVCKEEPDLHHISSGSRHKLRSKCTVCGRSTHMAKDCKYRDYSCHRCNKKGHLAPVCLVKSSSQQSPGSSHRKSKSKVPSKVNHFMDEENASEFEKNVIVFNYF